MSFDIFVQRFRNGDAHDADATAIRAALAPHLVEHGHGWDLHAGTATAAIYGVEGLASGFMINHVDGLEVYELLVRIAAAHDLVIFAPGVPTALTSANQLPHIPDAIRDGAKLVTNGADLLR